MKVTNIAELKNNLSEFLSLVEKGEEVQICKRNISTAHLLPINTKEKKNHTRLGCCKGTVQINGDLTDPMIPLKNWDMLKKLMSN